MASHYGPSVTEADHVVTLLRNDASNGIRTLEAATTFIRSSLPDIAVELQRLAANPADPEAVALLGSLEAALTALGAAAINIEGAEVAL
jgi:hypothetical protein